MNTEVIKVRQEIKRSFGLEFSSLFDRDDLEGDLKTFYIDLSDYIGFYFKEERVGFPGAAGFREILFLESGYFGFMLKIWPKHPACDTPRGYIDVFDPNPVLSIKIVFNERDRSIYRADIELNTHLYSNALPFLIKTILKARELWKK